MNSFDLIIITKPSSALERSIGNPELRLVAGRGAVVGRVMVAAAFKVKLTITGGVIRPETGTQSQGQHSSLTKYHSET